MGDYLVLFALLMALSSTVSSQSNNQGCSDGKTFTECGSACPRTCANYMLDIACVEVCVEGCFCPDDLVEYEDGCIPSTECPAVSPGNPALATPTPATPTPATPTRDCARDNGGCPEDQICNVIESDVGADYVTCQMPPYVPCGSDASLACDSEFLYCLQQNKTRQADCVASCLSDNGGCSDEDVCITTVEEDGTPNLHCQDRDDISTECPAGQVINQCGALCQETCQQHVSGEEFACIEICAPPACVCPQGLLLFRDRCVDPRLCYVLLTYPPAIDPLPIVHSNQYLYSLFSPNSSLSDFMEPQFLDAVSQLLNSNGYPNVDVELHGVYEDGQNGLQIVVRLSGEDVNKDTSIEFTTILQENRDELPLPVNDVSLVDVDRVEGKCFWSVWRIAIVVGVGLLGLVVLLAGVVTAIAMCCHNDSHSSKGDSDKVNVEIFQLLEDDEDKEKKEEDEDFEILS